jgi:hypothetical protein
MRKRKYVGGWWLRVRGRACLYLTHLVPENHSTKTTPHTHFAPMSGPISWLTTMRLQGMSSFLNARISRALSLTPRTAGKERKGAAASS